MCGLAAFISRNNFPAPESAITAMMRVIEHRGPDDSGTFFSKSVGFGFRRLAILDLTPAGHQPMHSLDGQCTIVFNGEIYNYLELREELVALGHQFHSGGDTEVLLHAYQAWGDHCVTRLNGMWAFLIHDRVRGRVFGSRDRFGMKPLYVYEAPEGVLLASEIKSIRVSGYYREALDWRVCAAFFHEMRLDESSATFFEGIRSLLPGHAFEIDTSGLLREWAYWQLPDAAAAEVVQPAEMLAELFENSVQLHLRSDVPVGVNLSGGLDSTSIICAIARGRTAAGVDAGLLAFSFMAEGYDESEYLAATLTQTGARQIPLTLGPLDLWDSLATVLWHQDEPVHSLTAVIGFHLSALAAQHGVKVILNGQAADEILGGYPSYFRDYWYSLLKRGEIRQVWREINAYSAVHGGAQTAFFLKLLRHFAQSQLRTSATYRRLARQRRLARFAQNDWLSPDLVGYLSLESPADDLQLEAVLTRAVTQAPLPLYLRVEDRNSMAHSIETRLPFLDPRLVEFAFRLAPCWKLRGSWNKIALREAMQGRIPENVRLRADKMGFPTPFSSWLRTDLYESARAVIEDRGFAEHGLFQVAAIRRDLERHRRGEMDIAGRLFDVMQFHLWRQLDPREIPTPSPVVAASLTA